MSDKEDLKIGELIIELEKNCKKTIDLLKNQNLLLKQKIKKLEGVNENLQEENKKLKQKVGKSGPSKCSVLCCVFTIIITVSLLAMYFFFEPKIRQNIVENNQAVVKVTSELCVSINKGEK